MKKFTFTLLALCFVAALAQAQKVSVYPTPDRVSGEVIEARKSPMANAHLKTEDNYLKIVYSQPHLRGRSMLGGKNAYGKVWRLGANEATEIYAAKEFMIGDQKIPAGIYSLFAIPESDSWTLIVSKQVGQWGAYGYDESMDQARIQTKVGTADKSYEAFSIWFSPEGDGLNLAWGTAWVKFPLKA
ncbi:MAG: DUF2911 domain-containing protein [Bacteroidota bacterium]